MRAKDVIYLDYQATTPLDPRVLAEMLPHMTTKFANASSSHRLGKLAAATLQDARSRIRVALGAQYDSEIVFTSGATEANYLAIVGAATAMGLTPVDQVITTAIEHKSVLASCAHLKSCGYPVSVVGVDSGGMVDPADIAAAFTPRTKVVSVMYANNEIGTVQPIKEIAAITKTQGALLHVDAVQAIGSVKVDLTELGADMLSISAHKIYGPKGIGALYIRRGTRVRPQYAGSQEAGRRAGTSNIAGAVGLAAAVEISLSERSLEAKRIAVLRDELSARLVAEIPGCHSNGSVAHRLPGNLSLTIPGVDAETLIEDNPDLAISTGSACASGQNNPSHVLMAIGKSRADARSTLRFSLGRGTQPADIEAVAVKVIASARRLRRS